MKKSKIFTFVVALIISGVLFPSCIGSFTLTNKLLAWNRQISNKFVNELVFFAFWILPVYEVSAFADVVVLNSIEFWSGENPVASGSKVIEGHDGKYLVTSDKKGYTIKNEFDGVETRLNFNSDSKSWSVVLPDGSEKEIFTFIDDTHISLPSPGSELPVVIELSEAGLYAYQSLVSNCQFAAR